MLDCWCRVSTTWPPGSEAFRTSWITAVARVSKAVSTSSGASPLSWGWHIQGVPQQPNRGQITTTLITLTKIINKNNYCRYNKWKTVLTTEQIFSIIACNFLLLLPKYGKAISRTDRLMSNRQDHRFNSIRIKICFLLRNFIC